MATPVIAAMFDAPWTPIFLLSAFLLHFWIGVLAVVAAILLVTIAWLNQRATQTADGNRNSAMAAAHNSQQAWRSMERPSTASEWPEHGRAQLGHRRIALANMITRNSPAAG